SGDKRRGDRGFANSDSSPPPWGLEGVHLERRQDSIRPEAEEEIGVRRANFIYFRSGPHPRALMPLYASADALAYRHGRRRAQAATRCRVRANMSRPLTGIASQHVPAASEARG